MTTQTVADQVKLLRKAQLLLLEASGCVALALADTDVGDEYFNTLSGMIEELDIDCADLCYNGEV
jgi:hypothetical protein